MQVTDVRLPPRFKALVALTTSERRVLFYLTEGWAAQDIAEELVVSLTTVRSHIRSVLRKLGVRSQLAAVAIANSRNLEHHEVGEIA
jgi:DNA-binding NarL/FixJ family response regulator